MWRPQVKASTLGIVACLAASLVLTTSPASAATSDVDAFSQRAEASLQNKLSALANEEDLLVDFSNFEITANPDVVATYKGNADAYAADVVAAFENDAPKEGTGFRLQSRAAYASSVFAGVPAGGRAGSSRTSMRRCRIIA